MTDESDISANLDEFRQKMAEETVGVPNSSDGGVADRLRQALVGKNRTQIVVAAGISDRTLSRALAGESIKHGTLIALAYATGVNQQWLIHGTGAMRPSQPDDSTAKGNLVGQAQPIPFTRPEAPVINADRMATALAAADQMFAAEMRMPTPRQRVQAMLHIYNYLTEMQAKLDAEDAAEESKK